MLFLPRQTKGSFLGVSSRFQKIYIGSLCGKVLTFFQTPSSRERPPFETAGPLKGLSGPPCGSHVDAPPLWTAPRGSLWRRGKRAASKIT